MNQNIFDSLKQKKIEQSKKFNLLLNMERFGPKPVLGPGSEDGEAGPDLVLMEATETYLLDSYLLF